ncbi:GNAT family N-acetyltransferase [Leucothrix arctica]|uniref:GNAT family N-acetyltransferase n=1 Tax=Leucothrix arctica TaxID=1481894 RepID=A0A317CAK4_9GAMM|nr:GNAT family N-acetyltransferase [Leucothrix arctica]PWQ93410.1 GNAT family N-acetyltransferase [Leucothrix arctica]
MEIRAVTYNEVKAVLSLIDELKNASFSRPNDHQIASIYLSLIESGGCVVGAFINGELVGTCTVNMCSNFSWSGRPFAIIENVIVSKKHRNCGVGKAVLGFARDFAEKAGCYKVALMTGSKKESTHKFYESAGFVGNKTGFQIRFDA